jgi:hypothetical protein
MKMMWDDEALYVGAWLEEPQVEMLSFTTAMHIHDEEHIPKDAS